VEVGLADEVLLALVGLAVVVIMEVVVEVTVTIVEEEEPVGLV